MADMEVTDNFTRLCHICGALVTVVGGKAQPHLCRIEVEGSAE